jgi:hypothetical protein
LEPAGIYATNLEFATDRLIVTLPREPFTGEGGAGAVAQQPFEAGAILGLDAHGGVQREPAAVSPALEVGGDLGGQRPMADGDPQDPAADPPLHGTDRGLIEIRGAVEAQRPVGDEREYAVGNAAVLGGCGR